MPQFTEKSDKLSWQAQLDLVYALQNGRSVLVQRRHCGPLVVQRPFYPEGPQVCHTYLLHPPGGVAGGDHLQLNVHSQAGARALLTTPGATKFYRSGGRKAWSNQHLSLDESACLEWLPQENILFDGSHSKMQTRVDLGHNSRFLGWEITCFGRPCSGEIFSKGSLRQSFELWRENKPLCIERMYLQGGSPAMQMPWGLAGYSVSGLFVAYPAEAAVVSELQEFLANPAWPVIAGITQVNEVAVLRVLGQQAEEVKKCMATVLVRLHPYITGLPFCAPRVWNT